MKKIDAPSVAEITDVVRLDNNLHAITYVRNDGSGGRSHVRADDWPDGYWPPAVGDLIDTETPRITHRARPR